MTGLPQHRDAVSTPQTEPLAVASVWRRLVALLYDSMLLFALLFAAAAVYQFVLAGWALPPAAEDGLVTDLPASPGGIGFQLYLMVVIAGFYCYFWRRNGQTLGMQAWRLRLDSANGGRPTLIQCLRRLALGIPSLLLAGAGYWWIWIDRDQLAWHDRFSDTRVVVLPK